MVRKNKSILKKILLFTIIYTFLFFSSSYYLTKNIEEIQRTDILEKDSFFLILDVKNPDQIIWHKNHLFIKKGTLIKSFNTKKRTLDILFELEKSEEQNFAFYKDKPVLIHYKNHIITDPKQKATDIKIITLNNEIIFQKSFHKTIKPIYIEENFLIAMDNYLNSPERTYRINTENGDIEDFNIKEDFVLEGKEVIKVKSPKDDSLIIQIPKENNIRFFETNKESNKFALIDTKGNLWIYLKNPNH